MPISEHKEIKKGFLNFSDLKMFKEIWADSWIYQVAIIINFTTTLIIFPAATVLVEPGEKLGKAQT